MRRLVFDAQEWNKIGDVGDNLQFWKEAEILDQYPESSEPDARILCDVMFEDGRVSKGHFWDATEEIQ